MASAIEVELKGDRKFGLRFDKLPVFRGKLIDVITNLTGALEGQVVSAAPSRTGKLRRSIKMKVYNDRNKITGRVAVTEAFAEAGDLEYGGAGRAYVVKDHSMRLDHVFATRLNAPTQVFVQAHDSYRTNAAKRFLRGPGAAIKDQAIEQIGEAVGIAIAET